MKLSVKEEEGWRFKLSGVLTLKQQVDSAVLTGTKDSTETDRTTLLQNSSTIWSEYFEQKVGFKYSI